MTRDDAIRAVNAWLDETLAEAKNRQASQMPRPSQDDVDAFVYERLVRRAASYGLALTDDAGGALPGAGRDASRVVHLASQARDALCSCQRASCRKAHTAEAAHEFAMSSPGHDDEAAR